LNVPAGFLTKRPRFAGESQVTETPVVKNSLFHAFIDKILDIISSVNDKVFVVEAPRIRQRWE